jgi:hypothetical protein
MDSPLNMTDKSLKSMANDANDSQNVGIHSMASGKFKRRPIITSNLVQFSRDLKRLSLVSVSSSNVSFISLPISGRHRFFHVGLGRHSNAGCLSMLSRHIPSEHNRPTINVFVITYTLSPIFIGPIDSWLIQYCSPVWHWWWPVDPRIQDFQFGSLIRIVFGMQCLWTVKSQRFNHIHWHSKWLFYCLP